MDYELLASVILFLAIVLVWVAMPGAAPEEVVPETLLPELAEQRAA
jgi:hypothetical protein